MAEASHLILEDAHAKSDLPEKRCSGQREAGICRCAVQRDWYVHRRASNSATGLGPITDDSSYYKTYQRRGPRIKKAQPGRSKESSLLKQKTIWRVIGLKPSPIAGQAANLAINPVLSANQRIHKNFHAEQKTATPEFLSSDADDEGDMPQSIPRILS
ncbi:hypothetical protein HAX54_013520, partial [Datura stramonium]|nr:hypothetical protein [Datura stramonium]